MKDTLRGIKDSIRISLSPTSLLYVPCSSFFFKSPLHFYGEIRSMVFGFDSDTVFLRYSSAQFT